MHYSILFHSLYTLIKYYQTLRKTLSYHMESRLCVDKRVCMDRFKHQRSYCEPMAAYTQSVNQFSPPPPTPHFVMSDRGVTRWRCCYMAPIHFTPVIQTILSMNIVIIAAAETNWKHKFSRVNFFKTSYCLPSLP